MKKVFVLFTIFVLLCTAVVVTGVESYISDKSSLDKQINCSHPLSILKHFNRFQNYETRIFKDFKNKTDPFNNFVFSPEDVELKDDAFHGADTLHFTEWWYFDAMFDNGYSIQVGIRVFGILNQGLVFIRLDIYKDGELESHELKTYPIWDFFASEEVPFIKLNRVQFMEGYINETTGDWVFDLTVELDESSAELNFVGCTKGWKGATPGSEWAVILPRAEVKGTIRLKNEEINVSGTGYHDHNWEVTVFTGLNFGWFWGKINSNNYTMTWAKIMTTRFWGQPLLVINEKNGGYTNIEPDYFNLVIKDFHIEEGMIVPHLFVLDAKKGNVSLNVYMDVFDTHHIRWIGIINYWRYHMRCTGSITVDSNTEFIDEIEIAEFIRFR